MLSVTKATNEKILLSTSSTSGFIDEIQDNYEYLFLAKKYLTKKILDSLKVGYTYMFEVLDPTDIHIVDNEYNTIFFLAIRNINTADYYLPNDTIFDNFVKQTSVSVPTEFNLKKVQAILKANQNEDNLDNPTLEGFVCYINKIPKIKFKTSSYLMKKSRIRKGKDNIYAKSLLGLRSQTILK